MYLSKMGMINFRQFKNFTTSFNSGLNILVGENNAGKSSIIDAIRIALDTTSSEWVSLKQSDFHNGESELKITLRFDDLSINEMAIFLEHLTFEKNDGNPLQVLYLSLVANFTQHSYRKSTFLKSEIRSGKESDGPRLESDVRSYLASTYLKPLRDAESELTAGRSSRLSQILGSNKSIAGNTAVARRLVGFMVEANQKIQRDETIQLAQSEIKSLLDKLTFKQEKFDPLLTLLGCKNFDDMSESEKTNTVKGLLEKLSLELYESGFKQGLGYNSLLFIASELMLLTQGNLDHSPLLLIEEPEAHLHPQLQLKFMKYLSESGLAFQCILSTHSPVLSSKASLKKLILMQDGRSYPIGEGKTLLEEEDYVFLEKFLDSTKANMFFAKGVIFVEGVAEAVLLPKIAELLGRSFEDYGVSIVNVNGLSRKRYAKVYRSSDPAEFPALPIKVACMTDLDLWPDEAETKAGNPYGFKERKDHNAHFWFAEYDEAQIEMKKKVKSEFDGDNVKTFISDDWTFEFCLIKHGLAEEVYEALEGSSDGFDNLDQNDNLKAIQIYGMIERSKAKSELSYVLAQKLDKYQDDSIGLRRKLPSYIIDAIEHVTESFDDLEGA